MPVFSGPNCVFKTILLVGLNVYTIYLAMILVVPLYGVVVGIYTAGLVFLLWWYIIDRYSDFFLTDSTINNLENANEKNYIFKKESHKDLITVDKSDINFRNCFSLVPWINNDEECVNFILSHYRSQK